MVQIYDKNAPKYVWQPGSGGAYAPPSRNGGLLLRGGREGEGPTSERDGREGMKRGAGSDALLAQYSCGPVSVCVTSQWCSIETDGRIGVVSSTEVSFELHCVI